ncbi:MAG: hypothetical protein J6U28_08485 [Bacteroidales bacterium]|nr:hypothetical protein [Bacteroidales bacterium]
MSMSLDDRYLCRMITDLEENIHGLYSGFASEEDYLKAINECHDTEEKLKEVVEDNGTDDPVFLAYFDATLKMLKDTAFGIGILMNGQGVLEKTLKKYDEACGTAISAIEERSGEKYDPAVDKAVQEDFKNRLQQMLVTGMLQAMAESGGEDMEEALSDFVKRMKELEDEKRNEAGDDEK